MSLFVNNKLHVHLPSKLLRCLIFLLQAVTSYSGADSPTHHISLVQIILRCFYVFDSCKRSSSDVN
jgi:hypothetical protein